MAMKLIVVYIDIFHDLEFPNLSACRVFVITRRSSLVRRDSNDNITKGLHPPSSTSYSFHFYADRCIQTFDAITTSPKSLQTVLQCLSPTPISKSEFCTIRLSNEGITVTVGGIRSGWQGPPFSPPLFPPSSS